MEGQLEGTPCSAGGRDDVSNCELVFASTFYRPVWGCCVRAGGVL
jgi:hypothetical protein